MIAAALPPESSIGLDVVRVYEDACGRGKLTIKASTGAVVAFGQLPAPVRELMKYDRKARIVDVKYVQLRSPPSTYVIVRQMKAQQPGMPLANCKVISNQIDRSLAVEAMRTDMGNAQVQRRWDWGSYQPSWSADDPTQGVRRAVYDDASGWIVMTTETYRTKGSPLGQQQKDH